MRGSVGGIGFEGKVQSLFLDTLSLNSYPASGIQVQTFNQQLDAQIWFLGKSQAGHLIHLGVVSGRPGKITSKWMQLEKSVDSFKALREDSKLCQMLLMGHQDEHSQLTWDCNVEWLVTSTRAILVALGKWNWLKWAQEIIRRRESAVWV